MASLEEDYSLYPPIDGVKGRHRCDLHNVAAYSRENVDFIDVGKGLAKGRVRQFESLTMFEGC